MLMWRFKHASAKNFLKWLSFPQEQSEAITYADAEMDARAIEAVKTSITKAKFCKKPVAKYDIEKKQAYLEFENGGRKYVE